jgi:hypothetical protein
VAESPGIIDGDFVNKFRRFIGRDNHCIVPNKKFPESPGRMGFDFQRSVGGKFL